MDYFRYFAPSNGGPIGDGAYMADIVNRSDCAPEDFFIFTASGTDDFAYSGFKNGVMAMAETKVLPLPTAIGRATSPFGSGTNWDGDCP